MNDQPIKLPSLLRRSDSRAPFRIVSDDYKNLRKKVSTPARHEPMYEELRAGRVLFTADKNLRQRAVTRAGKEAIKHHGYYRSTTINGVDGWVVWWERKQS